MRTPAAALALIVAATPAGAFDLIECDRDEVFGNAGATIGWGGSGGPVMGNWELDTSGMPGTGISPTTASRALGDAILEWAAVSGTTYTGPSTSPATFTAADIDATFEASPAGDARHIAMFVHDDLTRDGLVGWAALKSSFTTSAVLGVCFTQIDENRRVIDADIFLNDDITHGAPAFFQDGEGSFRLDPFGFPISSELQGVMAHEFGHAQGAAHAIQESSAMFKSAPNLVPSPLVEDDMNILRWLYPASASPVPPDRNNVAFISCDDIAATGELTIKSTSGGGCQLSAPRAATWPFGIGLFLLVLAGDRQARRRRRG